MRGVRPSANTLLQDSTALAANTVVLPEPTTPLTLYDLDVLS